MANIVMDIEEVAVEEKDASMLPGRRLREVREQRGLHVVDVAAELLLTEEQIRALEENDFKHFPAPLFIRGYLRKYAALLDIPDKPLIEAFENTGMEGPSLQAELTSSIPRPKRLNLELSAVALVAVGVLILVLVWLFSGSEEEVPPTQTPAGMENAPTGEAFTVDEQVPVREDATPAPESRERVAVVESAAPVSINTSTQEAEPSQTTTVSAAESETVVTPAPVFDRLLLQFNDDSWVEITDARGERLFFDLGRAGQSRLLEGQAPFDILLGNAPAVQIEYNGQPYSHKRFNRKNVARFKLGGESG